MSAEKKSGAARRYRRRKKIINPSYQLRLAALVMVFLLIYSLVLGIIILYPLAIELLQSELPETQAVLAEVFLKLHQTIWTPLLLGLAIVFWLTILFSHRVAGPIYRFERTIDEFLKGNFALRVKLRKRDEFKEIETWLNHMASYLESAKRADGQLHAALKTDLERVLDDLRPESGRGRDEIGQALRSAISRIDAHPHAFAVPSKA